LPTYRYIGRSRAAYTLGTMYYRGVSLDCNIIIIIIYNLPKRLKLSVIVYKEVIKLILENKLDLSFFEGKEKNA